MCDQEEGPPRVEGASHSRQASNEGLLLSVSALAGGGKAKGRGGCDSCEGMGQGGSNGQVEGEDGEQEDGGEEPDSETCDRSLVLRLQEELTAAKAVLENKDEQIDKLSKIRDAVESELQELTASLFQVLETTNYFTNFPNVDQ